MLVPGTSGQAGPSGLARVSMFGLGRYFRRPELPGAPELLASGTFVHHGTSGLSRVLSKFRPVRFFDFFRLVYLFYAHAILYLC